MATNMGHGIMAPETTDDISNSGVDEMRALGATTATAVGERAAFRAPTIQGLADFDTWRDPNVHYVPRATMDAALNAPTDVGGIFQHIEHAGGDYRAQLFIVTGPGTLIVRTMNAGVWGTWTKHVAPGDGLEEVITATAVPRRGLVPDHSNYDDFHGVDYVGEWYVASGASAQTMTNRPSGPIGAGPFKVISGPAGYGHSVQIYFPVIGNGESIVLTRTRVGVGAWSPWRRMDGGDDLWEPSATGMRNADLMDQMIARKGGPIGTGGKAAFALRVDHGTVAFRDILGPLLKKYGIPATMAVYSKQREVRPEQNGVPWPEVEQWHRTHGITFGNHSDDHLDKPDATGWHGGTIGSQAALKASMPSVPVEQYIPHGSIGYERYGTFNEANTHEKIVGTLAGRMALSSHALVAGYRGSTFRTLSGRPMQGQTHWTMESSTLAEFKTFLDRSINHRAGLAVMFHPEFIGIGDRMGWAEIEECLAYVALKREEGVLVALTLDGLAVADTETSRRDDLVSDPTSGATTLTLDLGRRSEYRGGSRCAEWHVIASAQTSITVTAGPVGGGWASTRTMQVPAGKHVVYLPFGIPLDYSGNMTLGISHTSGVLTVTEAHAYAS